MFRRTRTLCGSTISSETKLKMGPRKIVFEESTRAELLEDFLGRADMRTIILDGNLGESVDRIIG